MAACVLIAACGPAAVQPITVHLAASNDQPEHDQVVFSEGTADFYPDRADAHHMVYRFNAGGMIAMTCLDGTTCKQVLFTTSGNKAIPDGTYQVVMSDDPHIIEVRDSGGEKTLGFLAQNNGGGTFRLFSNLKDAQAFEHRGDAMRTAGKVAVDVALVAAVIAVVAAAAAGGAAATSPGY